MNVVNPRQFRTTLLGGEADKKEQSIPKDHEGTLRPIAVEPMDLDNMRSHGVSAVEAHCRCGRRAVVDVSPLPGAVEVRVLRWRLRCTGCGARPYDVRPNWRERVRPGTGMGC